MHALIMAGGAGSRLNLGEKPLILICGQPLVSYVVDAFEDAGCKPVIATSFRTPMTQNWCRAHGIEFCKTAGTGYVEDMVQAVGMLEDEGPVFISASDLPCITSDIISTISDAHRSSGKDACSAWVPAAMVKSCREGMPYREEILGVMVCPAGVNILHGALIDQPQDEFQLLLEEPRLALNINTKADLAEAEIFIRQNPVTKSAGKPFS
ncbi:MAG: 5-deoxyadenosylcobinamide phosphate nucleotidyltransferase [Methanomicrobiales archaeon HGW-Methanomicrobiales-1]|jgi:adenosylcobinamide-phosphate guanylyltransferase|nr:MAG: 5-deoxyadenosylcobinamide phosphate nucleotidyltransferase [Methanomicrobiales archaeon HGW-Methanomicrobiales-1]